MYGRSAVTVPSQHPHQSHQESQTISTSPTPQGIATVQEAPPLLAQETSSSPPPTHARQRITVRTLRRMKQNGEKIAMLTAYDAPFAQLLDRTGVEMLLVGDSLGMVLQGETNTLSVTMEQMLYHTRCVSRATKRAMVVGDMPFMSYQVSAEQALINAGRFVQEAGAHAVKLEGGSDVVPTINKITRAGIPVVGHLGLTPQSFHALGGFVIQGRDPERAREIKRDALAIQEAGACCLVLEGIPATLAREITAELSIPTIGIGAGDGCDGQVLVTHDMLGMTSGFVPSFVKQYMQLHTLMEQAVKQYISEVKQSIFP